MQILIDENNVIVSAVTVGGIPDGIEVDDMPSDCAYSPTKYKYVDNKFVLNPDYSPPAVDISAEKTTKIAESKTKLSQWLLDNPLLFSDGKYYSVTEEKQALLNSNIASYERAEALGVEYPLKWNSTGEECCLWAYDDLVTLSLAIAGYVAPKVSKQQYLEVQIRNCDAVEELDAIVIDYDE